MALYEADYRRALSIIRINRHDSTKADALFAEADEFGRGRQLDVAMLRIGAMISRASKVEEGFTEALGQTDDDRLRDTLLMITDQIMEALEHEPDDVQAVLDTVAQSLAFKDIVDATDDWEN